MVLIISLGFQTMVCNCRVDENSLELLFDYIVEQKETIQKFNKEVSSFLGQKEQPHPEEPTNLDL